MLSAVEFVQSIYGQILYHMTLHYYHLKIVDIVHFLLCVSIACSFRLLYVR